MSRFIPLSILAGIVAVLAFSAAPASAEFQAKQKQGRARVITSGEFKISTVGKTKCVAESIVGQWHIQAKGQIKKQQQERTKGPHLELQVKSWGTCETKINNGEGIATEVKPCNLQLEQIQTGRARGGVVTPCLIKIATLCEVQVPAGMETAPESGQGINVGLFEAVFNHGPNLLVTVNIREGGLGQVEGEGIFVQKVGTHPMCALPATTEKAELVGLEFEGEDGLEAT